MGVWVVEGEAEQNFLKRNWCTGFTEGVNLFIPLLTLK